MSNSIFPFIDTSKYEDVIESDKLEDYASMRLISRITAF